MPDRTIKFDETMRFSGNRVFTLNEEIVVEEAGTIDHMHNSDETIEDDVTFYQTKPNDPRHCVWFIPDDVSLAKWHFLP